MISRKLHTHQRSISSRGPKPLTNAILRMVVHLIVRLVVMATRNLIALLFFFSYGQNGKCSLFIIVKLSQRRIMGGCFNIGPNDSNGKQVHGKTVQLKSAIITDHMIKPFRDVLVPTILKRMKKTKSNFQLKLLYRGSSAAFLASKFHKATNGVPNTIVVVKSQFGMVFGGFTPCKWEEEVMYKYVPDPDKQSFLFRLTSEKLSEKEYHHESDQDQLPIPYNKSYMNIKSRSNIQIFDLLDNEHAILNNSEDGPIFGGGRDLFIADRCDKNQNWANIGKSYQCQYVFGSNKANSLLAGDIRFKIEEYEVWVIQFQQMSAEKTSSDQQ